MPIVPSIIRKKMQLKGINQTELARSSGLSQSMISKILSGERGRNLSHSSICAIARVLETTPEALIGLELYAEDIADYISKLRTVVNQNMTCAKLFKEAEALAKSIFEDPQYVPLPFYTEHRKGHCQALERLLDQIIWRNGDGVLDKRQDFIPSPEEAMYLLSAVWLHDIGMWYGTLGNEQPGDILRGSKVIKLRDQHEVRTARYILEKWVKDCSWEPQEKEWLSNICVYHRRHHPMNSFEPVKENGLRIRNKQIRLSVLAALLRLADACLVDKRRAPQRIMRLYLSLGMPEEARVHWERADLIRDIRFNHDSRRIELRGHYPRSFDFGLGVFDVREVGEMICENVRGELRSVQQTLSTFSNTDLREVRHESYQMQAIDYQQKRRCLYMWPYLLSRPFSATEAAKALAQMLLLSAEQAEESGDLGREWRKEMHQIIDKTKSLRWHDFMIRNLCIEVEKLLLELPENTESATKLSKYLNRFMESIEDNSRKLVAQARRIIGDTDVLVLYGHSVNICRLLRDIDKNHSLYIINCYKPLDSHEMFDENEKLIDTVKNLGFTKYKFLQLESLAAALSELKGKTPCKVLLGTHGRLKNGDFLCKVGSDIIAATAKRFGAKVIVFCEKAKFLIDEVKDDEIAGHEKLFSSEDEKKHPQFVNVPYVASKMDRVPKNLVDMVITESGVERRRKPAKRGASTEKVRSKGRKANKAR